MKNFSIILNIVLIAAVGFLYYKNFSTTNKNGSAALVTPAAKDSAVPSVKVAYVDLDSLNEKIVYFKQSRKDLEQLQKNNEAEITNDIKLLENKQNNFMEKNPNPTPEQIQTLRAQLMNDQESIEGKKQKYTRNLNQENFALVEKIRKELKDFFEQYNKDKKFQYILTTSSELDYILYKDSSLNITQDVIKGMNEKLKAKTKQ